MMHRNIKDITGQRFGHLIAEYAHPIRDKLGRAHWVCKCDCGNEIIVRGDNLRNGNTIQCVECRMMKRRSRFAKRDDYYDL